MEEAVRYTGLVLRKGKNYCFRKILYKIRGESISKLNLLNIFKRETFDEVSGKRFLFCIICKNQNPLEVDE